ncbi:hypothetical protein F5887DRAFT_1172833 [Amanita rubescens]|nr:hypothetical protein F5887DRAFT_1172833 [Amanita rubescens]
MSTTTPKVKLWLSFGNVSKLALSIPLDKCHTFAVNPLKWLRFLGFAIYGREGYLSTSKGGTEIDDYTADIEPRSYYFISEDEPRLVDVDAADHRTSNTSQWTTHRNEFSLDLMKMIITLTLTLDAVRSTSSHT